MSLLYGLGWTTFRLTVSGLGRTRIRLTVLAGLGWARIQRFSQVIICKSKSRLKSLRGKSKSSLIYLMVVMLSATFAHTVSHMSLGVHLDVFCQVAVRCFRLGRGGDGGFVLCYSYLLLFIICIFLTCLMFSCYVLCPP